MKKIITVLLALFILTCSANAAKEPGTTHVNKAAKYFKAEKYSEAIGEFSTALTLNYKNERSLEGIIKSYIIRGTKYYEKDKEWGKAANDFRSALFYIRYYMPESCEKKYSEEAAIADLYLKKCYKNLSFKKSNQYVIAQLLDIAGEYPAAAYEYIQASKNKKQQDKCCKRADEIRKQLGYKS